MRTFMNALSKSPSVEIITTTDKIAPVKIRKITRKSEAPWRNATVVQCMKRKCKKLNVCGGGKKVRNPS